MFVGICELLLVRFGLVGAYLLCLFMIVGFATLVFRCCMICVFGECLLLLICFLVDLAWVCLVYIA